MSWQQAQARGSVMLSFEGTIVADTYNPADSTVQVAIGEAFSNFDDPNQQPYAVLGKLFTMHIGISTPPLGGERCVVILTRGIPRVLMNVDEDDSLGTPPGEFWLMHVKPGTTGAGNTPVTDSGIKVTQDGKTTGDGLGGLRAGQGGGYSTLDTASGHQVALDDTAQTVTVKSAGGHEVNLDDANKTLTATSAGGHTVELDDNPAASAITVQTATGKLQAIFNDVTSAVKIAAQSGALYTLLDGTGNAISHVAPAIALGALAGNGSLVKAISTTDITTLLNNPTSGINIQRLVDMSATLAALVNAGVLVGGPTLSVLLAALASVLGLGSFPSVPSFGNIPVPSGSSVVKMLP